MTINDSQALEAWDIHWAGGSVRDIAPLLGVSISQAHVLAKHGAALVGKPYPFLTPLVGADAVRERRGAAIDATRGIVAARRAARAAGLDLSDEELWAEVGRMVGIPHPGLCRLRAEQAA